jgi:hypothetical protein
MNKSSLRKNPSRETCEKTIRRILSTEVTEHGTNTHFRSAADFMGYFESLYPASDALTKQVQRAVRSLDMAKDEHGFYIPDKTTDELYQEKELSRIFADAHVTTVTMDDCVPVFLSCNPSMREYLIYMLESSDLFHSKFLTAVPSSNGIIVYTSQKEEFLALLNNLTI